MHSAIKTKIKSYEKLSSKLTNFKCIKNELKIIMPSNSTSNILVNSAILFLYLLSSQHSTYCQSLTTTWLFIMFHVCLNPPPLSPFHLSPLPSPSCYLHLHFSLRCIMKKPFSAKLYYFFGQCTEDRYCSSAYQYCSTADHCSTQRRFTDLHWCMRYTWLIL